MSNENPTSSPATESVSNTEKVSPFLTEPLPQGAPQGQQQSLQQQLTDASTNTQVPKYNLPRGANTGNVGEVTHFGYKSVRAEDKAFIVCGSDSRLIAAAYAAGRPCWIWLVAPAT